MYGVGKKERNSVSSDDEVGTFDQDWEGAVRAQGMGVSRGCVGHTTHG